MLTDKKYIFCICIDNLRSDRLGYFGNKIGLSNTIDSLMEEGINCVNCYSNSNPTQFSYPYTFSSTNALDYGGYSDGVMGRPITLPEVFKKNGYRTIGLSTSPYLDPLSGYARGFDQFYLLFDMADHTWNRFTGVDLRFYYDLYINGKIDKKEYRDKAEEMLTVTFDRMVEHCDRVINDRPIYSKFYRKYRFINNDVEYLRSLLDKEVKRFTSDRESYLDNIEGYKNFYEFTSIEGGYHHPWKIRLRYFLSDAVVKRIFFNKYVRLCFQFNVRSVVHVNHIVRHAIDVVTNNKEKNFFIWMHLLDVHDELYSKHFIHLAIRHIGILYHRIMSLFDGRGINDLNLSYDLSIKDTDNSIGQLIGFLKRNDLVDESVIILFSDHGTNQGPPYRKVPCAGNFYEELTRVPFLVWSKGIERREITDKVTLADLMPTLCDLFEFDCEKHLVGMSIVDDDMDDSRIFVFEHNLRGPNDISKKPIIICIRHGDNKLIYKEYDYQSYVSDGLGNEYYSLRDDPFEQNNIFIEEKGSDALKRYIGIAQNRISQVRESAEEQIR